MSRVGKPFGAPESYETCPVCKQDWRKCDHSWEQADAAYLRTQQRKVLAGKQSNDIARVITADGVNLFLWHDGRVTWEQK